jgi:hypothetical protein
MRKLFLTIYWRKGAIPDEEACFKRKQGITDITPTKQQLVWFRYSANDYTVSNSVIIRVTGIAGTQWKSRLCTDQVPTAPPAPQPQPTYITITSVTTLSIVGNVKNSSGRLYY